MALQKTKTYINNVILCRLSNRNTWPLAGGVCHVIVTREFVK
jgi:hypothetical protein